MNRDNWLFIIIGVLVGFIAGYLVQEVMIERQPARLVHGDDTAAPPATGAGAEAQRQQAANARAQGMIQEMRGLETHLTENPDDAEATLRYGQLALQVGDWSGCIGALERYIDLRQETPDLLTDLGLCYRSVGQIDRSLALFDRAQEIDSDHWPSRLNEAFVLGIDRRDFEAADRLVEELRADQPDNPQLQRLIEALDRARST